MTAVVDVALPVFAIMLAGYLAGRFRILGASSSEALNTFVYWYALPPVLFLSMATVPLSDVFNWPFIWTFVLGMAAVALPSILIAKFIFPNSLSGLTLHGLTSIFANTGYMGIPLFIAAFGTAGTLPAVIATAVNSALIIGLSILFVEIGSGSGHSARRVLGDAVLAVIRGPLFIAPVAGILWSASGFGLPLWLSNFAGLMGDASGPCALFAMGLFLVGRPIATALGEVSWLVMAKLVLHPLVTWVFAVQVFELNFEFTRGAVLMAALPTGTLSFVIAQKYGIFMQRSSATILVSTVLSVVTVSALLAWFGTG